MQLEAGAFDVLDDRPGPVHLVTDRRAEEWKAAESAREVGNPWQMRKILTGEVAAGFRCREGQPAVRGEQ